MIVWLFSRFYGVIVWCSCIVFLYGMVWLNNFCTVWFVLLNRGTYLPTYQCAIQSNKHLSHIYVSDSNKEKPPTETEEERAATATATHIGNIS